VNKNEYIETLKKIYNYNLNRLNNGCKYCEEHNDEVDIWLPELLKIHQNMNRVLEEILEYEKIGSKDIGEGFVI